MKLFTVIADIASTTEPTSLQIGVFVLCAFMALVGLVNLVSLVKLLRNDAEKREVTINPDAASKAELDKYQGETRQDVINLHRKIERVQAEVTSQMSVLGRDVGKVSAQNEVQNQRLAQIDSKLDRLIERRTV